MNIESLKNILKDSKSSEASVSTHNDAFKPHKNERPIDPLNEPEVHPGEMMEDHKFTEK